MRASTTVTLLCLAASVAPSVAVPSIKSEREINPRVIHSASTIDTASAPPVHSVAPSDTGAAVGEQARGLANDIPLSTVAIKEIYSQIVNGIVSTIIFSGYTYFSPSKSRAVSYREQLERFDKRVKQELAARASKRELLTTVLDNLDR